MQGGHAVVGGRRWGTEAPGVAGGSRGESLAASIFMVEGSREGWQAASQGHRSPPCPCRAGAVNPRSLSLLRRVEHMGEGRVWVLQLGAGGLPRFFHPLGRQRCSAKGEAREVWSG